MTTLKTVWGNIKETAGIRGRWHDNRRRLITELAESGAGDRTIVDVAGHVSPQMLARYSHIRMDAKRKDLEAIVRNPEPAPQTSRPVEANISDDCPRRVQ